LEFTHVTKPGVRLRPTVEGEMLYHLVLELRKEGLSYNRIIRKIQADHGVTLRKSHISGWVNGKHKPFGYVRAFDAVPSSELAYVIGVRLGDASMSLSRSYNYKIKLRVIDKEFAEEFSRCLSVILGRAPPRVKWHEKTRAWHTEASSMLLQKFLYQDLQTLSITIEHCADCKAAFLRGSFDSEGSMYERSLTASNENLELVRLVCRLLQSLGIETTGPNLASRGGRTVMIKGKFYRQNEDLFSMRVRSRCLQRFQMTVGFSISRKSNALASATSRRTKSVLSGK